MSRHLDANHRSRSTSPTGSILISDRQDSFSPHIPQVGAHFFVIPSLSIGGTIGFESRGGSVTRPPNPNGVVNAAQPKQDAATFVFMPKVGYALMLSNTLGFWFRGGIGFFRLGASDPIDSRQKESISYWIFSVDALFVVAPVQHFGFYVGPQADISFAGSHSITRVMGNVLVENSANRRSATSSSGLGSSGTSTSSPVVRQGEAKPALRPKARQDRLRSATHDGDHGITAGHRVIRAEHDRRAVGGDLNSAAHHRGRRRAVVSQARHRPFVETNTDPIAVRRDPPDRAEKLLKGTVGKSGQVRPRPDEQHGRVRRIAHRRNGARRGRGRRGAHSERIARAQRPPSPRPATASVARDPSTTGTSTPPRTAR